MDKVSVGPRPYMAAMPAVLVGANVEGKPNYMTVAWAGVACMAPPMIAVAINKVRHTEKGILENKTFSVNVPAAKNATEVDYCGLVSGSKTDKSAVFETFYGKLNRALDPGIPRQYGVRAPPYPGAGQSQSARWRDHRYSCSQGLHDWREPQTPRRSTR